MPTSLQITFRHIDPSAAVEARVRELVEKLKQFHDRISGCHVVIEAPPAHRNKGAPFAVKIDLTIPGQDLHVNSEHSTQESHSDVYIALRDAFDTTKRLLQNRTREQRGDVKRHSLPHAPE